MDIRDITNDGVYMGGSKSVILTNHTNMGGVNRLKLYDQQNSYGTH